MSRCDPEALEALLYEELGPARAAEVEAHAAGCDACAAELAWLRTERQLMDERRRVESPLPDALWQAIDARIAADAAPRERATWWRTLVWFRRDQLRWFGFGAAAATAMAALLLVLMTPERAPRRGAAAAEVDAGAREAERAPRTAPAPGGGRLAEAERALAEAERAHLAAIEALEHAYRERRDELSPAVAARYDRQFRATRETIGDARASAGDDLEARWLVLDAYAAHRRSLQAVVQELEVNR